MKTKNLLLASLFTGSLFFTACQKSAIVPPSSDGAVSTGSIANSSAFSGRQSTTAVCNSNAYIISLESVTEVNGTWEWVWSVQNPNPGNGTNGTVQNLSHWGMQFGACFDWASVVSAAYSGDGSNWTSFTPSYSVDPSQGCLTTPILKFDYGTTGSQRSYYKLVVSHLYVSGASIGYFKSGNNTGCCTFSFPGIACGGLLEE
jgi:hypothetical protein